VGQAQRSPTNKPRPFWWDCAAIVPPYGSLTTTMPPDPTNSANPPSAPPTRRGILKAMSGSLLGLGLKAMACVSGLWAAALARFMTPNAAAESPQRFKAGLPSEYPPDRVETRFQEKHGVWVVNGLCDGRRQIFALRAVCTHLGCITIYQAGERRFKCPCHGSGFHADGVNFEGPAHRPLERCAIRVAEDGQLEIDASRTFQAELGQWSDPASYVAA
jgi:cytochrome b6-f complex iron-sulfur subunit